MSLFDLFTGIHDAVIDLYFVLSDLKDIPISDDEQVETACFDSLSTQMMNDNSGDDDPRPMGKRVY